MAERARVRPATQGGFTLLEVMVSLAILAVSLVAILNLHSGSVRVHNHAKHLTVATLLARSKMVDIEEHLLAEGLSEFDQHLEGTFEEEGYPGYSWEVEVVKPRLDLDSGAIDALMGQAMGFLGGDMEEAGGGMFGELASMAGGGGGIEGLITGQVRSLLDTLETSVREIRLTIAWSDITGPSDFSVVTHVVRMAGQGAPGGAEEREQERIEQTLDTVQQVPQLQQHVPAPSGIRAPGSNIRINPRHRGAAPGGNR